MKPARLDPLKEPTFLERNSIEIKLLIALICMVIFIYLAFQLCPPTGGYLWY